jgi:hypothetical protein
LERQGERRTISSGTSPAGSSGGTSCPASSSARGISVRTCRPAADTVGFPTDVWESGGTLRTSAATPSRSPASRPESPGQPVVDTFSGFASAKETLWTFDSASPCAATAEAEYPPAVGVGDNAVNGSFSLSISSVPLATSSYRCAYLQAGAPSAGKPTGPTLAAASALITVS